MTQTADIDTNKTWRRALVASTSTLHDAIRNLNESSLQIALVVAAGDIFIGTVTDGDIRRALLRGLTLTSSIDEVVRREPLVAPPGLARDLVIHLMRANRVHQLPVVNEERKVVGLYLWDEIAAPQKRPNLMVVMAGGQGMRLRPHTERCPKPLLRVAGKPMLEHIIERARGEGFERFVLAVHYLGHMIEDYFGSGEQWGVEIEYLREKVPLGTAGAISLLRSRPDSPIVVTNGDVLTDIRFGEMLDFHSRHHAAATMAVRLHEWQHPFGVVRSKGVDIIGFEEKPIARTHINAGIYVLEPTALDTLKPGEHCDMPTLFSRLHQLSVRTIVYPMHEPWLDVGRSADLELAQSFPSSISPVQ